MSNFRKFISMGAIAVLGVTNMLMPLSYATAADVNDYDAAGNIISTGESFSFIMPNHDVFLKAYTEANHYFVKYNGNTSTSWSMERSEFIYDETWTLTQNVYEKLWYTFVDWNDQVSGDGIHYADKADVKNLTTQENGEVNIHAQWTPNIYNLTYDLNDRSGTSSWVHTPTPDSSLAYDTTGTIAKPSRTWYAFKGWDISGMDGNQHNIGTGTYNDTSLTEITATKYKNLRATSGTVKFVAQWIADSNTQYTVEHYLENLTGWYPTDPVKTDNLSGTTDTEVKPSVHTYEWFTKTNNTPHSGNINADGSTVFRYEYTRNSYNLTLNAGRWIKSVKWTGTVNAAGGSANAGQSTSILFKYDEPVTLAFTLKDWYKNWVWSGYSGTVSEFNMPAKDAEKIAYATPIDYTVTGNYHGGTGAAPYVNEYVTTYNVEWSFTLPSSLTRDNSIFSWWIGEGITTPQKTVTVGPNATWNRLYEAVWDCEPWYHLGTDQCVANEDTEYEVRHYQEQLDGSYELKYTETPTGKTDTRAVWTGIDYTWFSGWYLSGAEQTINWDVEHNKTIVYVRYDRNSYGYEITAPAWGVAATAITSSGADWANSHGSQIKYEDTVTLSATMASGYEFDYWVVKDSSNNPVNVTNSGNIDGATFKMPASTVTIIPHLKKTDYEIKYDLNEWELTGWATNPGSYNVETETFTLANPERDNSTFVWWSGWVVGETPTTQSTVTIVKWSTEDRAYEAIWSCNTWYHAEDDSCVANNYKVVIDYKDGGNGGGTRTGEVQLTYDQIKNIPEPRQSWYDFAWWIIEWMSGWVTHTIWNTTTTNDSANGVHGTGFKNLTVEEDGIVTFTATWTPRSDTKFTVYHYYEDLGADTYTLSWTDLYTTWVTASEITLRDYKKDKIWFTYAGWLTWSNDVTHPDVDRATLTTIINKDGSTKIYLYYQRFTWYVYLSGDEHIARLSWTWRSEWTFDYGATVNVNARAGDWYHFKHWRRKTDSTFTTDL